MASAVYPATGDSDRPTAVVLVDKDDWQGAIAAAVLSGRPIGAPILLTDGERAARRSTEDVLKRLKPEGLRPLEGCPGDPHRRRAARPDGFKTAEIEGDDPFERAAAIDRFFSAARGKPVDDVVLVLGRAGRVRDAGRRMGGALGRRGAAHAQQTRCRPPT